MEDAGIPNRTQLLRIHLPAVGGLYVSAVTPTSGLWGGGSAPARVILQIPVKVELHFALPAAVGALCSGDGAEQVQPGRGAKRPGGGSAAGEPGAVTDTRSARSSGLWGCGGTHNP